MRGAARGAQVASMWAGRDVDGAGAAEQRDQHEGFIRRVSTALPLIAFKGWSALALPTGAPGCL